jgi:hypothetical protein
LALRCIDHAIPLPLIQGNDLQAVRRQRPLQLERRSDISLQPPSPLRRLGQHHPYRQGWARSWAARPLAGRAAVYVPRQRAHVTVCQSE